MPIGEPAIRRTGVVGPEDLGHEEKKFSQPPLFQRAGDRVSALAFTESLALHVRMRHIVATTGAIRFQGNDVIRLMTAELVQSESNFERAEVDFFQNDPFGPDAEDFGEPVDLDFVEFVLDGLQFLEQQSQRR